MTLPSPNVHDADDQEDGPANVFKRLSSHEDKGSSQEEEESEMEDTPPASALHRRRALVPPKMMTDDYESTTDDGEPHSPTGDNSPNSKKDDGSKGGRRSSIVVIPPMQICPGDLLVYSKVLSQRNTLLDYDGSTQSLSMTEDTSKKGRNAWSLLRLFDRSGRSKPEPLGGLEEVLSNLRPSEFIDEHLAKYKGMLWSEFVALVESRSLKDPRTPTRKNSRKLRVPSSQSKLPSSPPPEEKNLVSSFVQAQKDYPEYLTQSNHVPLPPTDPEYSTLDELEHRIENLGTLTRSRNELKRREAMWDLFQSECMFLYDHLMVLKNVFMEPLKKIQVEGFAMFAEPEVLFGNLDELCCNSFYHLHSNHLRHNIPSDISVLSINSCFAKDRKE